MTNFIRIMPSNEGIYIRFLARTQYDFSRAKCLFNFNILDKFTEHTNWIIRN